MVPSQLSVYLGNVRQSIPINAFAQELLADMIKAAA